MQFSRTNMRNPSLTTRCPLAAAASLTEDYNVSKLARLMGKSEKTVAAKLNNDYDTHHLNLFEAIQVTELTNDERILRAWAESRDKVLFDKPGIGLTDDEFSDLLLMSQERAGHLAGIVRRAREDGVITDKEYSDIYSATVNQIETLLQIAAELKEQVREIVPSGGHDE